MRFYRWFSYKIHSFHCAFDISVRRNKENIRNFLKIENYKFKNTLEEINEKMPLEFSVEPDIILKVLMQFKPLEEYIEIPEQKLTTPERNGFVVVEWGGSEIK